VPQDLTASGGTDGNYRWYEEATNGTAISGAINSIYTTPALTGTTTYYVSIDNGTCESTRTPVVATINDATTGPSVTAAARCGFGTVTLTALGGSAGNYRWYDVVTGGTAITGETNSTYTTPALTNTTTYYVSIDNGTCESGRTAVAATVNTIPAAPSVTAGSRCGPGTVTLTTGGGTNGEYRWYDVSTGGTALAGETASAFTTPSLTTTTQYFAALNNGACESTRVSVDATINNVPAQPAITASGPTTFCTGGSVTLSAPAASTYTWSTGAITQQITVNSPGVYSVSITAINGCTSQASNSITVAIQNCPTNQPPTITTTPLATETGGSISFNLVSLLADPDNNLDISTLRIVTQPQSGAKAFIDASGNLDIDYSNIAFSGKDRLVIGVCDMEASCVQQELIIEVTSEVLVYNALSPNGDGMNDTFIIQYIDIIPETQRNKVTIFNRWGDVVSETENYDNKDRVFKGFNKSGNEVPSGTYYYKIEFSSGRATKMGYLLLKR
jgi:gliding motility-associated-like protein